MEIIYPVFGPLGYLTLFAIFIVLPILSLYIMLKKQPYQFVWALIIIYIPLIGPILYLLLGRKKLDR